jgi:DNA invertase Pin-like site-specific DNA recombinase
LKGLFQQPARQILNDQRALTRQRRRFVLRAHFYGSATDNNSPAVPPSPCACLAFLREADVLTVTKPDRLARSTAELLSIEADLSKRKVGLVILSMGGQQLDTRNPTSKLMLTIMAGIAAWEREIMLERQREGIAKAKTEGKYKGRAPTARKHADQVHEMRQQGISATAIARELGINRASVYRIWSFPR